MMDVWLDQCFMLDVAPTTSQHLPANDIGFFLSVLLHQSHSAF